MSVIDIMQNGRMAALCQNFPNQYKLLMFIVYFPCKDNIVDKCKKLNSLKHPVRTTVAGSHN